MGEGRLRISLLDQLLDDDPATPQEALPSEQQAYRTVIEGLKRDLLELLNTRKRCRSTPDQWTEVRRSVFSYGIPDIAGAHLATAKDRDHFLSTLGPLIRRCDRRFKTIRITPTSNREASDRILRFRIEATVHVESGIEPIAFDFQLEPATRTFES
ncbi:MAG: type VI secretion system baseplate subunit TssE [Planctomycetota bacterium]|nr:type VI secretion system baseplate subunit TssE [Planctomycetota bacterium]